MDFAEPLSYPLKDLKKLVIGGLMVFPGMLLLLIPLIMSWGYMIKVAGDTVKGKNELPEFNDWGYFLTKGLGTILIYTLYGLFAIIITLPATILYFMFIFSLFGGYYTQGYSYTPDTTLMILAMIFYIIAFIPLIVLSIMEMIACVRYGEKGNVGVAFEFRKIYRKFKTNLANYIIGFLVLFGFLLVIYIVMIIAMITIVGILFIGIILFYVIMVQIRMFAQIYKESKVKLDESGESTLSRQETAQSGLSRGDEWKELK